MQAITPQALVAFVTLLTIAGGAVLWAFRRVNSQDETDKMVRLFMRAFAVPGEATDDEIVAHIRRKIGSDDPTTGEHPAVRVAPRRPALRRRNDNDGD